MSRVSHASRLERLRRQLRGEPVLRIFVQDWVLELMGGPLSAALMASRARLGRSLLAEEFWQIVANHRASEPGR